MEEHEKEDDTLNKIIEERKKKFIGMFKGTKEKNHDFIYNNKEIKEDSDKDLIEEKTAAFAPDEDIFKERKTKALSYFKKKYNIIVYILLAIVVYISFKIRTKNLSGLRDITTGGWTLGPDLDPFLFMRLAKHIVENGSIIVVDTMRYVPLGFETKSGLLLHPYLIAWFHKIASIFGSASVEQSAALYPAFFFMLTVIIFFFLVREIFIGRLGNKYASSIALISSFFLSVLPSLVPRTIAGIPEKESAGFFFMFLAFYLFILSWKSRKHIKKYTLALFSGVVTAMMALVWGGYAYIFVVISLTTIILFFLYQIKKDKFYIYSIWLFSTLLIMTIFSNRYSISNLINNFIVDISLVIFLVLGIHHLMFNTKIKKYFLSERFSKIPKPILSLMISIVVLVILISILFGPSFIFTKLTIIKNALVTPISDRLGVTVAENRQPYYDEWSRSFGPIYKEIPVFFWLFFIGSIVLFYNTVNNFGLKQKIILTMGYVIFLFTLIFSRYKPSHLLNGENSISLLVYFGGAFLFLIIFGVYYFKYYKAKDFDKFKSIDFTYVFLISFFVFSVLSVRSAVRLILALVPAASIMASYLLVISFKTAKNRKGRITRPLVWIVFGIILVSSVFAGNQFYKTSESTAQNYVPGAYNQQWQKAMSWVRGNTDEGAVFGHWWDYGYWVQGLGERSTIVDGGNNYPYWNHLIGRYALTGSNNDEALDYLFSHGATHFLIDSTDIGKYTAFSSIGSDENYDRRSWLSVLLRENANTVETKNNTVYVFNGGFSLDEDINYKDEDKEIYLPREGGAGLGAVRLFTDNLNEPVLVTGIYVYDEQQYEIPIRYAYFGNEFVDFGRGLEAGVFIMPRAIQSNGGLQVEENGAMLYLSRRTVKSQLARLYLYGEENSGFKVAHIEDDFLIASIKSQGANLGDFIYFQGFRGPIKIWEINYPEGLEVNEEFLETSYPNEALRRT